MAVLQAALQPGYSMQVYAAEAQAVKLKPESAEPATAKHEDRSPKLEREPLEPVAAKWEKKSATLQPEPVEAATPKKHNITTRLEEDFVKPVAAEHGKKNASLQSEPVQETIATHDDVDAKLPQDPVKPAAAGHGDKSATLEQDPTASAAGQHEKTATLRPGPVEDATARQDDATAKLSPGPVEAAAAKHGEKGSAKQAEEVWNERIKGAYAAVAASTPYRPAAKKPSSNALSWHRSAQHLPHVFGLCCCPHFQLRWQDCMIERDASEVLCMLRLPHEVQCRGACYSSLMQVLHAGAATPRC